MLCVLFWSSTTPKEKLSEKNTQHYIWRKKYGGGSIMIWGCFAGKMNSQVYHGVLWDNVRVAVGNKSTEWLQRHKSRLLEWPSQSPDLSPIEMCHINKKQRKKD
uniref:Uncharacterized protein n=1 Tax=Monopterus albus TaxID=43700 RepID=A0A3Q3K8C0_MONAL